MKHLFDEYRALNEPDNYTAPDYDPVEDAESYLNAIIKAHQEEVDRDLYRQYQTADNIIRRSNPDAN